MASFALKLLGAAMPILFVSVIYPSPSHGVPAETLATICSLVQNHTSCESFLRSDPRTPSADLPQLSLISIELMMKQATHSCNKFSELRDKPTSNPAFKAACNNCIRLYRDMETRIQSAHRKSEKRQYHNITELQDSRRLAMNCAQVNYLLINEISETMLEACRITITVNQYVASLLP